MNKCNIPPQDLIELEGALEQESPIERHPGSDSVVIMGESAVIFLDVTKKDIVFLQALFESYEGVGTIRTIDQSCGLVSILTTPSMLETALGILNALPAEICWRFASHLHPDEKSRYVELLQ